MFTLRSSRCWFWCAIVCTLLKVWLTRGQTVFAIGPASIDDRLFLRLGNSILNGEWLGTYDNLTLVKGPFYPMWVAGVSAMGVPLRLAEQLAYAGACALLIHAIAPILRPLWARTSLYLLLLWNPMTYEMPTLGRVLRQNIYTPLAIVIFAALIALYARRDAPWKRLLPWACTLGLSLSAFWLTREESIWIAPSVIVLMGTALWGAWRSGHTPQLRLMLTAFGTSALLAVIPILTVCALNAHYYKWFGTVEYRAAEFHSAYGALLRVRVGPEIHRVPVTREAREAIYAVSPAFAELRPFLEGELGATWSRISQGFTNIPAEERQIAGGWFMWCLRDAVTAAGHTHNAGESMAFFQRIADEVNQACDEGRLPSGPRRSGFLPPWRTGQTQALASTFVEFADFFASFRGFNAHSPASIGDTASLQLFQRMTRERLSPSPDSPATREMDAPSRLDEWRTSLLQRIGKALRWIIFSATIAAHAGAVWLAVRAWRERRLPYPLLLAVAAWGACLACLLINALVHITSFPTLSTGQFAAAYPLLLLFVGAVVIGVTQADQPKASNGSATR